MEKDENANAVKSEEVENKDKKRKISALSNLESYSIMLVKADQFCIL